jgi:hypothetical protein
MTKYKKAWLKSVVIMAVSLFLVGIYAIYLRHGGEPTSLGAVPLFSFGFGAGLWCLAKFNRWWCNGKD